MTQSSLNRLTKLYSFYPPFQIALFVYILAELNISCLQSLIWKLWTGEKGSLVQTSDLSPTRNISLRQYFLPERPLAVLYCTILYCTVLYCTAVYCTVLYQCKPQTSLRPGTLVYDNTSYQRDLCTVLYCTLLYCTVLSQ